jgi:hypothetical protein
VNIRNEFTYDVFLSHSAKDKAVVRPLAERLRADGLTRITSVKRLSALARRVADASSAATGSLSFAEKRIRAQLHRSIGYAPSDCRDERLHHFLNGVFLLDGVGRLQFADAGLDQTFDHRASSARNPLR